MKKIINAFLLFSFFSILSKFDSSTIRGQLVSNQDGDKFLDLSSLNGGELISSAISYRQEISDGEFEFRSISQFSKEPPKEFLYRVLVKGDRMRSHRWHQNIELVTCFGCFGNDFVSFTMVSEPNNVDILQPLLTIRSGELVSRHNETELEPDPRLIGMLPNDYRNSARYRVRELLSAFDQVYKVSEESFDNQRCAKIEFTNHLGAKVSCWLVPEKENSFVRLEIKIANTIYNVKSVVSFLPNSKKWFPERVLSAEWVNGVEKNQEELVVRRVSLDPVNDKEFTIASMNVAKPGTFVFWSVPNRMPPSDLPLVWDGNEVVSANSLVDVDNEESEERVASGGLVRRVLLNLGLIGLVLGGWLIWRSIHRSSSDGN